MAKVKLSKVRATVGRKGGKSRSRKKVKASQRNIAIARRARWSR